MVKEVCGVILAAGAGSRLGYLNELGSKPMVKIYNKPLLAYGLERLSNAGINDIALVVNSIKRSVIEQFAGNGSDWEVNITYVIQEIPWGIAYALSLCKEFSDQRNVLLLFFDNLCSADISAFVNAYTQGTENKAEIFIIPVNNPQD